MTDDLKFSRRGMFGSALSGFLGFFSKPATNITQFTELKPARISTMSFVLPKEQIAEAVKSVMSNMKVILPDGSFQIFPLTTPEDFDTIIDAPSTG